MSNVRLSNGSPTLERGTADRDAAAARVSPDHPPKPSACRNLFGSVDHEELRRDLKGHLRGMEEAASAKWNFDFANHAPLASGRFDWEIVDCRDVPDFYSRTHQQQHRGLGQGAAATGGGKKQCIAAAGAAGNNNVDVNGNHNNCVVLVGQGQGSAGPTTTTTTTTMEHCTGGGQRKRPACHEATAQTKRSHTSSDEVRCPNNNNNNMTHSTTELTPRKSSPKRQT